MATRMEAMLMIHHDEVMNLNTCVDELIDVNMIGMEMQLMPICTTVLIAKYAPIEPSILCLPTI